MSIDFKKPLITINAYEYGRWELHPVGTEYWQVYKMKGKTGSWLDNCYTLEEALRVIHGELEGVLPREFTNSSNTQAASALDRHRS